jgi:NAD(P)-dependent dehydrogenase (short-subunit alcohol dehydrogenase family)
MADGADVLAVDLNVVGLAEATVLVSGEPGRCVTLTGNITKDDAPTVINSAGVEAYSGVRILVNSAGTGGAVATHMTVDDDLDRFLDVNLRAPFRMARGLVTAICTGGKGGSIVQLVSTFGIMGVPNSSVYSATKAVVIGLTSNMAAYYGWRPASRHRASPRWDPRSWQSSMASQFDERRRRSLQYQGQGYPRWR